MYSDSHFTLTEFQYQKKEIVAKDPHLVATNGARIAPAAPGTGGTVGYKTYYAGTVLGMATSGPNSGFLVAYASGNSDGSQAPYGVLRETTTVDSTGNGGVAPVIIGGILYHDNLIGLDSGAVTALNGRVLVENGISLFKF